VSRLFLVRHGRAAAGWDADPDPGLDEVGRQQAEAVADELDARVVGGSLPLLSSPLRRCRETAQPLEVRWSTEALVDRGVGEVESPTSDLAERGAWLGGFMRSRWDDQPPTLHEWRELVLSTLRALDEDTVVFSHFIAINVAVGDATGDRRVVSFAPDNCSVTELVNDGGRLGVVSLGRQASTQVR
jgi:broad specificity phosphatase PhoE